jgi:hypothetical protein
MAASFRDYSKISEHPIAVKPRLAGGWKTLSNNVYLMRIIIDFKELNICLARLAVSACTEKVNPMILNLKTGFLDNLFGKVFKTPQIRIDYFFTLGTNYVGVRIRLIAVITITSIRESKFQDLVELFKQIDRLVDGGDAGCWEFSPDRFIDPFDRRMSLTRR